MNSSKKEVSLVVLCSVCEWGKFSSNYRFIASFPLQHFDCCKKNFTFCVSFTKIPNMNVKMFSQHFTHIGEERTSSAFLFSDASALAQVNESKIERRIHQQRRRCLKSVWSHSAMSCWFFSAVAFILERYLLLVDFLLRFFHMYKYSNLYVTSGVKRWNYYCLVSRDALGESPQLMSPISQLRSFPKTIKRLCFMAYDEQRKRDFVNRDVTVSSTARRS